MLGELTIDLLAELPDHPTAICSACRASAIEIALSNLPIRPVMHPQIAFSSVLVL